MNVSEACYCKDEVTPEAYTAWKKLDKEFSGKLVVIKNLEGTPYTEKYKESLLGKVGFVKSVIPANYKPTERLFYVFAYKDVLLVCLGAHEYVRLLKSNIEVRS